MARFTPMNGREIGKSHDLSHHLLLGGELGNSNTSDIKTMQELWPRLVELRLDTVLAPVYWELLEPDEGAFDFTLIDELLRLARASSQRLVLLWFGTWKNSMSCYVPRWVKLDAARFPRSRLFDGSAVEILTAFSGEVLRADCRAFAKLMAHLREVDSKEQTVVFVQVENEVGMLEQARDACPEAEQAYRSPVPNEFLEALRSSKSALLQGPGNPEPTRTPTWREAFGEGVWADEIFQAYYYARFVDQVAAAGKREYDLPLFVNAALNRPIHKPGQYPSAGPLPHLFEVWKFAAPHLDFLSPDIYYPDFERWCHAYDRPNNRLYIPEATNGAECAVNALYAIGACGAMGYNPFAVEAIEPSSSMLPDCYSALRCFRDAILRARDTGCIQAVIVTRESPTAHLELGGIKLKVSHDYTWDCSGPDRHLPDWPRAGALIVATGPEEFVVIGTGIIVNFTVPGATQERLGILRIDEHQISSELGREALSNRRRLNGDESHQGRHLRIAAKTFGAQTIQLYRYR